MDNIVNRFWKRTAADNHEPYRKDPWSETKTLMMGSMPVTYRSRLKESDHGAEIEVEFSYTEDGQEFQRRSQEPMGAEDQIRSIIETEYYDREEYDNEEV